jgi:hypothetical protein
MSMSVNLFGKVGASRREIAGKACRFCGGRTYLLNLQGGASDSTGLSAKCTHCQRSRKLDGELKRILWV